MALSRRDRTVVLTIHQPNSLITNNFDDFLLLAGGSVVFGGPYSGAVDYFAGQGFPCPQYTNPTDHFLAVLRAPETAEALAAAFESQVGAGVAAGLAGCMAHASNWHLHSPTPTTTLLPGGSAAGGPEGLCLRARPGGCRRREGGGGGRRGARAGGRARALLRGALCPAAAGAVAAHAAHVVAQPHDALQRGGAVRLHRNLHGCAGRGGAGQGGAGPSPWEAPLGERSGS